MHDRSSLTVPAITAGTVFRHRRHGYLGVVAGWDRACARDDAWASERGLNPRQVRRRCRPLLQPGSHFLVLLQLTLVGKFCGCLLAKQQGGGSTGSCSAVVSCAFGCSSAAVLHLPAG